MRRTCLARRLGTGLAALLAAGCLGWPASKPKLKVVKVRGVPSISAPVWRVDLRAFGYADHVGLPWKTPEGTTVGSARGQTVFVDQHTLLVTFERRIAGKMASRNQLQETSPLRFQAVSFQADSGKMVAHRDWGMSSPGHRVVTAYNGKFVLLLEQKLVLHSSALALLKELEIPWAGKLPVGTFWRTHRSPSGKTIWLVREQVGRVDYQLLDSETLSSLESWSAPDLPFYVVADDKQARMEVGERLSSAPTGATLVGDIHEIYEGEEVYTPGNVAVRQLGGAWTVVCKGITCGFPHFVNNDVLALDEGVELRFIRADGQPLSPRFRIGQSGSGRRGTTMGGVFSASAQGERFAVPLFSPRPDIGTNLGDSDLCNLVRILVFDLPSGQWIGALEASQYKIERICDAALSPDGTLLALFRQEGIVEVYPLPATPAPPQAK